MIRRLIVFVVTAVLVVLAFTLMYGFGGIGLVEQVLAAIWGWFQGIWTVVWGWLVNLWQSIWSWVTGLFSVAVIG